MEIKKKREEEFRRTCTFQPNVGKTKNRNVNARSAYRSRTPQQRRPRREQQSGMEECTFRPKINPISKQYGSALLYVQNNVHDRLSTPRGSGAASRGGNSTPKGRNGKSSVGADRFMNSLNAAENSGPRPRPSPIRAALATRSRQRLCGRKGVAAQVVPGLSGTTEPARIKKAEACRRAQAQIED